MTAERDNDAVSAADVIERTLRDIGVPVPEHLREMVAVEGRASSPLDEPSRAAALSRAAAPDVATEAWPAPLDALALRGLVGDVVGTIAPHSEADEAALVVQLLVAFGSCAGSTAHALAEADRHGTNLFAVLVGDTAKGRKGTSWGRVKRMFELADPEWLSARVVDGGLASGEGLVHAVRDPLYVEKDGEQVEVDPGVRDKRLLAVESEFASVLKMIERAGNTLSPIVRAAWDHGTFRSLVKNSPHAATGAHISLVGHITRVELRRCLTGTESANGFANRILWMAVRRSKALPDGGRVDERDIDRLARSVRVALDHARRLGRPLTRTPAARDVWHACYAQLSDGRPGMLGAITSRAEAQVLRLSVLYAALDRANAVDEPHLRAALAVWRRCEESARWIFGSATGDPIADELLDLLRASRDGLTRTEVRDHFGRHRNKADIDRALGELARAGLAHAASTPTGGRPVERWFATKATKGTSGTSVANVAYVAPAPAPPIAATFDPRPPWEDP
jgi:hypothetical protein